MHIGATIMEERGKKREMAKEEGRARQEQLAGVSTQYELNAAARNSPVHPPNDAATILLQVQCMLLMSLVILSTTSQGKGVRQSRPAGLMWLRQ
jgi:hypothetical protein